MRDHADTRILLVEDQPNWRRVLGEALEAFGVVTREETYAGASARIAKEPFDLAVIDLGLPERALGLDSIDAGRRLLGEWRRSDLNGAASVLVVTGHDNEMRQAFHEYRVWDFIAKSPFNEQEFLGKIPRALRDSRLARAIVQEKQRHRLRLTFTHDRLRSLRLAGPSHRSEIPLERAVHFAATELAARADALALSIRNTPPDLWRSEMKHIGEETHRRLFSTQQVVRSFAEGRQLDRGRGELSVAFSGPRDGLGTPFELLRDDQEYFAFNYAITRQLTGLSSRKSEPFHEFLGQHLEKTNDPFCVLVIGANSDGCIPAAETEAVDVAAELKETFRRLAIPHEIDVLCGPSASYQDVLQRLESPRYHLVHYAGHGRFDDELAEISGLVLVGGTLTASSLKLLAAKNHSLRMVFLSCCLGARTTPDAGRGDFCGVMDALGQADVPVVLGYRWPIADAAARSFALSFYRELWRTLAPDLALLAARRAVAIEYGRDESIWAAPVMLMQGD